MKDPAVLGHQLSELSPKQTQEMLINIAAAPRNDKTIKGRITDKLKDLPIVECDFVFTLNMYDNKTSLVLVIQLSLIRASLDD